MLVAAGAYRIGFRRLFLGLFIGGAAFLPHNLAAWDL